MKLSKVSVSQPEVQAMSLVKTSASAFYKKMQWNVYLGHTNFAKMAIKSYLKVNLSRFGVLQIIVIGMKTWPVFVNWMRIWMVILTCLMMLLKTQKIKKFKGKEMFGLLDNHHRKIQDPVLVHQVKVLKAEINNNSNNSNNSNNKKNLLELTFLCENVFF